MKKNRINNRIIYKNNETIEREANAAKSIMDSCPDIHDDFDGYFYYKVTHNLPLTERELRSAVNELEEVERVEGGDGRWQRSVSSYLQCKDKIICIEWQQGLTECQENDYSDQPYFVVPHTYEKTITVTEYVKEGKEQSFKPIAASKTESQDINGIDLE